MCLAVTYTTYATSSKKQTGDIITFVHFEEGNLLSETREDAESDDKSPSSYYVNVIISPVCSFEDVA